MLSTWSILSKNYAVDKNTKLVKIHKIKKQPNLLDLDPEIVNFRRPNRK